MKLVAIKVMMRSFQGLEAATGVVLWKKMFLKILQNSQENTCVRVRFLIKLQALLATLLNRDSGTEAFL